MPFLLPQLPSWDRVWLYFYTHPANAAVLGVILVCLLVTLLSPKKKPSQTTHGSARWATRRELIRAGAFNDHGMYLARVYRQDLRTPPEHSALLFGGPGEGKSSGSILTTIVGCDEVDMLIVDMNGELVDLTRDYRATLGPTYVFDPADPESEAINPHDLIRWGTPYETLDAQRVAGCYVWPEAVASSHGAEHFERIARPLLTMGILYAHYATGLPSSPEGLLDFFSSPGQAIPTLLQAMAAMPNHTLQRSAGRLSKQSVNALRDDWSAAVEWLTTWDDPILARATSRTTIPWWRLQHGRHPMTVYLRLSPADARGRLRSFFWLLLEQMTTHLATRPDRRRRRGLFDIFDDMAEFGRLPIAADIASYRRKDGIFLMGSFQTPSQWWHAAGRYDGLFGSCGCWVIYRQNEPDAAEYLSRKLGDMTVVERTMQVSQAGWGASRRQQGYHSSRRRLIDAGELMALGSDRVVVCLRQDRVQAERLNVYTDPRFKYRLKGVAV